MPANKIVVYTENAPKPRPQNSQAIVANGFVFCSGQLPKDPVTGRMADGTVKERTHQCIKNLQSILEAAGTSLDNVVEVNVFLSDMRDFAAMNGVYALYWGEVKPSRTCVAVKALPENTDVEIKCIAVVGGANSRL